MKIRTALLLTGLMLVAGSAFAQRTPPGDDSDRQRDPAQRTVAQSLKVPVILDGVQFPAGYILPDNVLTFVLERSGDDHILYAFTSYDVGKEFMRQSAAKRAAANKGVGGGPGALTYPNCSWPQDYSWFNKNPGCNGSGSITLSYPDSIGELDSIGWNNSISCVKAACISDYTVLYSCRYWTMTQSSSCQSPARLYVPGGDIISDLNLYNFNNKTSSIQFEP